MHKRKITNEQIIELHGLLQALDPYRQMPWYDEVRQASGRQFPLSYKAGEGFAHNIAVARWMLEECSEKMKRG